MSPTYDLGVHGDHHALWINPQNPKHLILGNDGGLYFSFDGSITWDKVNNMPMGQFYGIGVDMATPYNIYGGLQDTHSFGGPSATRHYLGILNEDWVQINTGDGMFAQTGSERSRHDLHRVAGWQPLAVPSADRRSQADSAGRAVGGDAVSLQLDVADRHLAARLEDVVLRRQPRLPIDGPWRHVDGGPRPDARGGSQRARRSWR